MLVAALPHSDSVIHIYIFFSILFSIIVYHRIFFSLSSVSLSISQESEYISLCYPVGEGNGTPLQYFCLENRMDGGAWWAAVYGVAQSWTRLKRLSSSSNQDQLSPIQSAEPLIFMIIFHWGFVVICYTVLLRQ